MNRLKWKQYILTIFETGEVRTLPATSNAIARDLARQRLAEDYWLNGDFSVQRDRLDRERCHYQSQWKAGSHTAQRLQRSEETNATEELGSLLKSLQ